jgi:hypothetical protein
MKAFRRLRDWVRYGKPTYEIYIYGRKRELPDDRNRDYEDSN